LTTLELDLNDIPDIDDTNLAIKQILESHQLLVKQ
jgi:hypothetical protein